MPVRRIQRENAMLVEVKVPVLAESVAEASLLHWRKQVGDEVKFGEGLIDLETDKVTLEIVAPDNGVLVNILKSNGEDVESNEVIAQLDTEADADLAADEAEPGREAEPTLGPGTGVGRAGAGGGRSSPRDGGGLRRARVPDRSRARACNAGNPCLPGPNRTRDSGAGSQTQPRRQEPVGGTWRGLGGGPKRRRQANQRRHPQLFGGAARPGPWRT